MQVPDALRAQFFLSFTDRLSDRLSAATSALGLEAAARERTVAGILTAIAKELDQILLPAVIQTVAEQKENGELQGASAYDRYRSTFVVEEGWNDVARGFPRRYAFLFAQIASYTDEFASYFERACANIAREPEALGDRFPSEIALVEVLSSDRHTLGSHPLKIVFEDGHRLVYKQGRHDYYRVLIQLAELVGSASDVKFRFPYATIHGDFTLIEFISKNYVNTQETAVELYRNYGGLLAFLDVFNYCDGHFENVVTDGTVPVVVDLETAFQSFEVTNQPREERSVLYTGLIQTPPKDAIDEGISAAIQTPGGLRQELVRAYAVDDRTDELKLRYRGFIYDHDEEAKDREVFLVQDFVGEVVHGFESYYELLASKASEILAHEVFWDTVASVRVRQLIRTTLYYMFLLRRSQMPDLCNDPENALEFIWRGLENRRAVAPYELYELRHATIPIFYHYPNGRDVFDGFGRIYPNWLQHSAVNEVRRNLSRDHDSYVQRSVQIIRENLETKLDWQPQG